MIYIESRVTEPEFNLALEQYIFDSFSRDQEYFMLWQNENAIIIGKNQNTAAEINRTFVDDNHIHVVRRLSGGGAVYHDLGNLNFTYIIDAGNTDELNLHLFCEPVAAALKSLGADARVNGRNDITIDGRKFSGNAQYLREGRIMHHGTILFDSDLGMVSKALQVSKDKIEGSGIASVRSRVTNIKKYLKDDITLTQFKALLAQYIFHGERVTPYQFTEKDITEVRRIRDERYATWEWNYGKSPSCKVTKERRLENCGKIEIRMNLENGKLSEIWFYGDYFGIRDAKELGKALIGCRLERQELNCRLSGYDVGQYFLGCSREKLVGILMQ